MAVDVKIIVGRVCPCPRIAGTIGTVHAVFVGGVDTAVKVPVEILYMLYTDVAFQGKPLDRIHLDKAVTEYSPAVVAVVTAVIHHLRGVREVGTTQVCWTREVTVDVVNGYCRVLEYGHCGHASVGIGGESAVLPVGHHEVFTHLHVFSNVVCRVDAGRIAAVEGVVNESVLVDIVEREHYRTFLAAVGNACREVVCPCRRINGVLPVGVGTTYCVRVVEPFRQLRSVSAAVEGMRRRDVRVLRRRPVGLSPLLRAEHVVSLGNGLEAQ